MHSNTDIWDAVLTKLSESMTPTSIKTWFEDCQVVELSSDKLVVHNESSFRCDVIRGRYLDTLKRAIDEIFSGSFDVEVVDDEGLALYMRSVPKEGDTENPIRSEYTFENFVVGNSNKFAHAASMAVADDPAGPYNPLFIYGESGLGKTHLLHAIANRVRLRNPEFRLVYIKGDDFTNDLIRAIRIGKNMEFRERYRNADMLLVDDIQFIAGRESTQEEFFHTFNSLYESRRQIVLTADRPPKEMAKLEDRLITRFEWGLTADIQPPEFETRVAITRNKAQSLNLDLSDTVIDYIAQNVTANVRQLEGTIKKVLAHRDIMESPITVDFVSRAIRDMYKDKTELLPTPSRIKTEVAAYFGLDAADLAGKNQSQKIVQARQIAMYLIRKFTNMPLEKIGTEFGNRHHTTVLSSITKVEANYKNVPNFPETMKDIMQNINSRQ